ncbi:MAG: transposase, partial [Actinobacteria bacterium]|nr:transposase [Actinomycetota bacterium]
AAHAADIPLYPELRGCTAPSTARIVEIFTDLTRHELRRDGRLVQTFQPELSPLHQQVLHLLDVPTINYTSA